jgi:hypothetical protein
MLRRYVCAAVVVLLVGGIALADTIRGLITSASDKEIKVVVREKGKKGKGTEKTLKVTKKTEVLKRKGKDDTETSSIDALKEAIENSKGKVKGVRATIEEDDGTATKITFGGRRKGGKKKEDK